MASLLAASAVAVSTLAIAAPPATAAGGHGGTLIIGMTAANIPNLDTELAGLQGYEGDRFVGNSLYDGLTRFNLLQSTKVPQVVPALAASWTSNADATVWTFSLRPNVTFQDGTPFNADAVIFNFDRDYNPAFPYYSSAVGSEAQTLTSGIASYSKVDDATVQITMKTSDSHLPSDLTTLYMASPTAVQKEGNDGFALKPVGTGPFQFVSETTGQELVLAPNKHYWAGAPKLNQLILKPIPDPSARIAALRSGAVNWIEYPTPDDISSLKSSGYQVLENTYDHIWPWIFDTTQKPWDSVQVRQAANYAINRKAMATSLLHGTAQPAYQLIPPANSAYSSKNFTYSYNPKKAKQLLKQAGYPNGFTATISYPTSGSGNMVPVPMNEELQHDLAAVGIHITLVPMEWSAMLTQFITGKIPGGTTGTNISLTFQQESIWEGLFLGGSPINDAHYNNPTVDSLLEQAQSVTNSVARAQLYTQAGNLITQDAPWLFVVNDENPRALATTVHGFIEPKSWFVNLTSVWVS
ncbi:MAG TPA: ABC transporter substrate-binding protein [Acidimicrobiales bacterium]|jgi:peptide/nickel transport system substrate-binding protein|nr:ABC transporter substrate-binding protein [Acidimicrobiales bacterium]